MKILRVNMTRLEVTTEKIAAGQELIGGRCLAARILNQEVSPDIDPLSEDAKLVVATGPLAGTNASSMGRLTIGAKSPLTHGIKESNVGGPAGQKIDRLGIRSIVIEGCPADGSLYVLYLSPDNYALEKADDLKGLKNNDTASRLRDNTNSNVTVVSIGLGGERRWRSAAITCTDKDGHCSRHAARGGLGSVMGAKGLKAIVVRGTKDINVARPAEFNDLCQEVMAYIRFRNENPIPGVMPILAGIGSPQEMKIHDEKWHTENFMWGNSRVRRKDFWTEEIAKEWTETMESMQRRLISCYNCPMTCGATIQPPGQPTYMMKCFSKLTYTMAAFSDLEFGLGIAQSATEYGVDGFSAPQVMAFALELLEKGILSADDFPGMPDDNEGRFRWLLDRIVRREGIGDVLANGTYWAAQEIGNGAEEYAHNNIKKHEQLPLKLSMLNPIYFLMYSTGEKINITQIEGQFPQAPFPTREEREAFVKDWIQVPDEKFKQYFLDWELRGENSIPYYPTVEMCCDIVDWQERMHYIDDALGMCAGLSSFPLKPPYHIHNYPKFISAGAGIEMDEASLTKAVKRYRTLVRANNIRRGMRRKDEKPPANHWKKRFPELEEELLSTYYAYKGWNHDGIPTQESLHELGLDYVAKDFLERGILTAE